MADYKFSVAMSVYKNDRAKYVDRALKSITEEQTLQPDEVVIVFDGPIPKDVEDVVVSYAKKYVFNVIKLEKNGGLGNALKIAVEACKYDLIARMDSDDVSVADRFEQQINAFKVDPDLDIIGGDISEFIDDEKNVVSYRKVPQTDEDLKTYIKKRCPFNHVSVTFKKQAVLQAGGYLDFYWNEDYYLWIRMFENNAKTANTGTVLVNVRVGKDMYKRRGGLKYYKSEKKLQKYMLKKKIISFPMYFANVFKRFILQVLLPNGVRGWVFKTFAREK